MKNPKLLAALGGAFSLAAAGFVSGDLPTWLRALGALPAFVLVGMIVWRRASTQAALSPMAKNEKRAQRRRERD